LTYVGTVSPSVNLTDATGASLLGEFAPLTVASAPSASVAESRSQVDVGQPARFRVIGSGGSGDYLAQWPSLPTGCAATGGNVTCVFEQPGVFTLAAEITDAAGVAANASNSVVVDAALAIALTAFPLKVDEGAVVLLNATAEGGMPAYGFQYLGLWPGCASADVARLSCPTMEPGPWNLSLMVTDANGFTVNSAPIIVQIFPRPAVTLFVTPSMPRAGAAFTVLALPDGGQAPYRFNWTAVPADCAAPLGPNLTCQAAFGENDSFGVAVTDAAGRTAGSSLEVEVSGPPPPPTSPAAPPPAFPWSTLVVLGAIAAAVAVGAVVLARQRPPRTPVEDADPAGGSEYLDLNGPGNDSRGGG